MIFSHALHTCGRKLTSACQSSTSSNFQDIQVIYVHKKSARFLHPAKKNLAALNVTLANDHKQAKGCFRNIQIVLLVQQVLCLPQTSSCKILTCLATLWLKLEFKSCQVYTFNIYTRWPLYFCSSYQFNILHAHLLVVYNDGFKSTVRFL